MEAGMSIVAAFVVSKVCAALAIFASLALPPRNSRDRPPALRGLILAMSGGFVVPLAARPVATLVLRG